MSDNLQSSPVDRFVETVRALLPPDADAAAVEAFRAALSDLLADIRSAASVQSASGARRAWDQVEALREGIETLRAEVEALANGRDGRG